MDCTERTRNERRLSHALQNYSAAYDRALRGPRENFTLNRRDYLRCLNSVRVLQSRLGFALTRPDIRLGTVASVDNAWN